MERGLIGIKHTEVLWRVVVDVSEEDTVIVACTVSVLVTFAVVVGRAA